MQIDCAEQIRAVADKLREVSDGMAGSRYYEIREAVAMLEDIARLAERRGGRPGKSIVVAHNRGRI